jgi:tRNA (uracil-5-)-methyltransferase
MECFYRNKCEFTFGVDSNSNVALGFTPGGWSGSIVRPAICYNVSTVMCELAATIEGVVRAGTSPIYEPGIHKGFWRQVTVRTSNEPPAAKSSDAGLGSIMIVVQHSTPKGGVTGNGPDYTESFEAEKKAFADALCDKVMTVDNSVRYAEANALNPTSTDKDAAATIEQYLRSRYMVTSLVFQEFNDLSLPPPSHPIQVYQGDDTITQRILNCRFKVSHGAFFQVNPGGADLLYTAVVNAVKSVTSERPGKSLCFDVCCGTGSIGLTCIDQGACDLVVGVDISEPAIEDAKKNVLLNGRDEATCRFVAGRAEVVMKDEIKRALSEKETSQVTRFIAVVDPAREGLHKDVLKALRNTKELDTIVYVSCNPTKSLVRDAGALCSPVSKLVYGKPFRVKSAQPVDMFPQTEHAEMLMIFER